MLSVFSGMAFFVFHELYQKFTRILMLHTYPGMCSVTVQAARHLRLSFRIFLQPVSLNRLARTKFQDLSFSALKATRQSTKQGFWALSSSWSSNFLPRLVTLFLLVS